MAPTKTFKGTCKSNVPIICLSKSFTAILKRMLIWEINAPTRIVPQTFQESKTYTHKGQAPNELEDLVHDTKGLERYGHYTKKLQIQIPD